MPSKGIGALRLVIYGSRSFANTVTALARDCGHRVVGLLDDWRRDEGIIGTFEEFAATRDQTVDGVLLGIGYNDLPGRWRAWQRVRSAGFPTPTLVHPRAYVAETARLDDGCLVMAGAIVDRDAKLGQAVVVWPGVCVSHETEIGGNTFLSPSATLCGNVHVGAHCFVGAGACIAEGYRVAESSFVKMGERLFESRS